tara:strand:- start:183 stop:335 length:153 start_codon:yes stop_codon:yes gene_type:complete
MTPTAGRKSNSEVKEKESIDLKREERREEEREENEVIRSQSSIVKCHESL